MNKKIVFGMIVIIFLVGSVVFMQANSSKGISGSAVGVDSIEIVSKRTYDSKTYANEDGTFTTKIFAGNAFFYDGEQYVELEKLSNPRIEKKEVILEDIPKSNLVDFGSYELYSGLQVEVSEEGELLVKDANDKVVKSLQRPFSTDNSGDVLLNDYFYEFEDSVLDLYVEVDEDWLKNAEYPVVVDPTAELDNETGIYDGHINYDPDGPAYTRVTDETSLKIGFYSTYNPHRAFIEFDTSSIDDDVTITDVDLDVYVTDSYGSGDLNNITGFVLDSPSDPFEYPDDDTGNGALFDDIKTGGGGAGVYLSDDDLGDLTGYKSRDLGTNADSDLEANLPYDFFAVGIICYDESTDNFEIASSEYNDVLRQPQLTVTYTGGACSPPGVGDWECNTSCTLTNQNLEVAADLHVQDNCTLTLAGTTEVYFSSAGKYIYVYSGGEIRIEDSAQLSAPTT